MPLLKKNQDYCVYNFDEDAEMILPFDGERVERATGFKQGQGRDPWRVDFKRSDFAPP